MFSTKDIGKEVESLKQLSSIVRNDEESVGKDNEDAYGATQTLTYAIPVTEAITRAIRCDVRRKA